MPAQALLFATHDAGRRLTDDAVALIDPAAVVYAADGAGHASGKSSASLTWGADEALLAAPACLTAWGDKRPLVAVGAAESARHDLLEHVYAPVCTRSLRVGRAAEAQHVMREALAAAASDGPVQVLVAPRAAKRAVGAIASLLSEGGAERQRVSGGSAAAPGELASVASLAAKAQRPAILCGGGAVRAGALPHAVALADRLAAPLLLTMAASCLPVAAAQALSGQAAAHPAIPLLTPLGSGPAFSKVAAEADLVLALGVDFSEVDGFRLASFHPWARSTRFVVVGTGEPAPPSELAICARVRADALAFVDALHARLPVAHPPRAWTGEVARLAWDWAERFAQEAAPGVPIPGGFVARTVLEQAPERALFVAEGSGCGVWLGAYLFAERPRPMVFPAQEATIGVTVPIAIGAAVAEPGFRAVGLLGDGAALYHVQELASAARLGVPLVLVVFNNRGWNLIRAGQTYAFGGRHVGVDLPEIDYAQIARGYGCLGLRARSPADLESALQEAFAATGPALIDVAVDPEASPYMGALYAMCELDGVLRAVAPDAIASAAAMVLRRRLEPRMANRARFLAEYLRHGRSL